MTYTPGEIRAAEDWARSGGPRINHADPDNTGIVPNDAIGGAEIMAAIILRHRADYDAEGVPLPVDDAFCIEMGAEPYDQPDNLTCLVWEDDRGWPISKGVFGQWYIYGNELPETAWPATRPQLRALIDILSQ